MSYSSLTADVPLGPFQDAPITVHSARSKNAKLHAARTCTQLRSSDVTAAEVPLNAETISRMCSRCEEWGRWAPAESGLGVFLHALCGLGLLHQLTSYTAPDPDDGWEQSEVEAAATLLRIDPDGSGEDEEDDKYGEQYQDARKLWSIVLFTWREAAQSLHLAGSALLSFPWLAEWAEPKLAAKQQYLETVRAQAALFVDPEGLTAAAAATVMEKPARPVQDARFGVIGPEKVVDAQLSSLWRRWQQEAEGGWAPPSERKYLSSDPLRGMRSNRKGYGQALAASAELIASWESRLREVTGAASPTAVKWVTMRLPEIRKDRRSGHERGFLSDLDEWTTGVLLTCLTHADWASGALTVQVPQRIADRLVARSYDFDCKAHHEQPVHSTPAPVSGPIRPGVFDDTPVCDRQPLTADHLRLLRSSRGVADELYIVFSTDSGAETLSLPVLEKRLAGGWQCFLLAGASDLPTDVIDPWVREVGPEPEDRANLWPEHTRVPHDPLFGEDLGLAHGATRAAWQAYYPADSEPNLRLLAMARGVQDLRTLDGGHDDSGRSRTLPHPVWLGLLTHARNLDLTPFEAPNPDRWHGGGSGIPLAVLADVQIYTTNADPKIQGKGHSPFCRHSRERGVVAGDDLLALADLLGHDDDDHWCGQCWGYAVRRLTDAQLSYYRAAHRLHEIAKKLTTAQGGHGPGDLEEITRQLAELADWRPVGEARWYGSGSWEWKRIVRDCRAKAESSRNDML